jgi:hypothetical protein
LYLISYASFSSLSLLPWLLLLAAVGGQLLSPSFTTDHTASFATRYRFRDFAVVNANRCGRAAERSSPIARLTIFAAGSTKSNLVPLWLRFFTETVLTRGQEFRTGSKFKVTHYPKTLSLDATRLGRYTISFTAAILIRREDSDGDAAFLHCG